MLNLKSVNNKLYINSILNNAKPTKRPYWEYLTGIGTLKTFHNNYGVVRGFTSPKIGSPVYTYNSGNEFIGTVVAQTTEGTSVLFNTNKILGETIKPGLLLIQGGKSPQYNKTKTIFKPK